MKTNVAVEPNELWRSKKPFEKHLPVKWRGTFLVVSVRKIEDPNYYGNINSSNYFFIGAISEQGEVIGEAFHKGDFFTYFDLVLSLKQ